MTNEDVLRPFYEAAGQVVDCDCPPHTNDIDHWLSGWTNGGGPPCWGDTGPHTNSGIHVCGCHSPVASVRPPDSGHYEYVCGRSGRWLGRGNAVPRGPWPAIRPGQE